MVTLLEQIGTIVMLTERVALSIFSAYSFSPICLMLQLVSAPVDNIEINDPPEHHQ